MRFAPLTPPVAIEFGYFRGRRLSFSWNEFTGALGDSITVLPVVVAVAALTPLPLGRLLLGFAAFQVVWGLHYGVPVSVEPMKALAALVIAGAFSTTQLAAAGLLAGAVLLAVGLTGTLDRIEGYIGRPVVRGVQLAVALVLLETGVGLSLDNPVLAVLAVGVAALAVLAGHYRASPLAVLAVGLLFAGLGTGLPAATLPPLAVSLPPAAAFGREATLGGVAAQLAMTVGNAAVATSLLLSEYFEADVPADDLATSMGAMNLLAVPLGGMPMCHGSGGVAGKYAFGARTAGANLILAALYVLAAVLAVELVAAFPLSMLGVVLALVAVELGRAGLDTDCLPLTLAVGVLGLLTNVGLAFVAGTVGYLLLRYLRG